MDGSALPTASTLSGSIVLMASRTVAASLGCSMWQLHFSTTVFTSRHHNRCGTSLTQGRYKTLNSRGHVQVMTSQYPWSCADRYKQSPARPLDRRDRFNHGSQNIWSNLWGIRLQNRDNISGYCIHESLPLVLGSSDSGAHRAQITNGSFATFGNGRLRCLDFTPLCQNQLVFRTFESIT